LSLIISLLSARFASRQCLSVVGLGARILSILAALTVCAPGTSAGLFAS